MAATLVVGTFATTTTIAQPASAAYGLKKRAQGNQTRDNNGNGNGGGRGKVMATQLPSRNARIGVLQVDLIPQ
jgi:hypothetical protein